MRCIAHVQSYLLCQMIIECFVSWYCFIYFQAFNDEKFKSSLKNEVVNYRFKTSLFDIVVSTQIATEYMKCKITCRLAQMVKPCDNIVYIPQRNFDLTSKSWNPFGSVVKTTFCVFVFLIAQNFSLLAVPIFLPFES